MSQRRHDGGERGGSGSWLPSARVAPRARTCHRLRCVEDGEGRPVWYDYISPGNRIVRIDTFFRDDRPLTVEEYAQGLRARGCWVESDPPEDG